MPSLPLDAPAPASGHPRLPSNGSPISSCLGAPLGLLDALLALRALRELLLAALLRRGQVEGWCRGRGRGGGRRGRRGRGAAATGRRWARRGVELVGAYVAATGHSAPEQATLVLGGTGRERAAQRRRVAGV